VVQLAKYIKENCPSLLLRGLMTIGSISNAGSRENPDFEELALCKEAVAHELGMDVGSLELSMGMSSDFEDAVRNLYYRRP
jgi:PLP dependent protein